MKRNTIDHPKTKRLCRLLGVPTWGAVGVLESIWHFTARHAPLGDIGKWSDEEIAYGIDWGDDPKKLIEALITAGWVDRSEKHRLVIHDWHDHADDSVKKFVQRKGGQFATSPEKSTSCPDMSRQVQTSPDMSRLPLPLPVPLPEPLTEDSLRSSSPPTRKRSAVPKVEFDPSSAEFSNFDDGELDAWRAAYPAVDIDIELRRAGAWAKANPKKRKKDWRRFLNGWFDRTQERGGTKGFTQSNSLFDQQANESFDQSMLRQIIEDNSKIPMTLKMELSMIDGED